MSLCVPTRKFEVCEWHRSSWVTELIKAFTAHELPKSLEARFLSIHFADAICEMYEDLREARESLYRPSASVGTSRSKRCGVELSYSFGDFPFRRPSLSFAGETDVDDRFVG